MQSGAILIAAGVGLNILGRVVRAALGGPQNRGVAGMLALLMLASLVIGLFGLVWLVSGLINRH